MTIVLKNHTKVTDRGVTELFPHFSNVKVNPNLRVSFTKQNPKYINEEMTVRFFLQSKYRCENPFLAPKWNPDVYI